jgi:hypothetical protein
MCIKQFRHFASWEIFPVIGNIGLHCIRQLRCIIHMDVVAAIVPYNLAAFPPSVEVNADIA